MKKTKGVSFEEKRRRMQDIFKEDPSFYHLKDIEKLGVKKGIIFMSIKDVLDSLVGDNLVETEKIGASNFFWALPSKIYQVKKNNLDKNKEAISNLEKDIEVTRNKIKEAKTFRKETEERANKLDEVNELKKKIESAQKLLDAYQKNDPERYKNVIEDTKQLNNINELFKDNILSLDQWIRSKNPDVNFVEMFPEVEPLNIFD